MLLVLIRKTALLSFSETAQLAAGVEMVSDLGRVPAEVFDHGLDTMAVCSGKLQAWYRGEGV